MPCVAVCCSVLQWVAVWCHVILCVAASVLPCVAECCMVFSVITCSTLDNLDACCRVLFCYAVCCCVKEFSKWTALATCPKPTKEPTKILKMIMWDLEQFSDLLTLSLFVSFSWPPFKNPNLPIVGVSRRWHLQIWRWHQWSLTCYPVLDFHTSVLSFFKVKMTSTPTPPTMMW